MAAYRIYFLGQDGHIAGREDFDAEGDTDALRIARVLCDACSDICDGFELWQGRRRIPARQAPHVSASLADLSDVHQRVVIDTEEIIHRSQWRVAQSQKLIGLLATASAPRPGGAQNA